MAADKNGEMIVLLKAELEFVERGGYRSSARNPWKATSIFLDSPTCINAGDPRKTHPCLECPLMEFVPAENRTAAFPCHHIPLTPAGDTVNSVERWGSQDELEEIVKGWLRSAIRNLELNTKKSKPVQAGVRGLAHGKSG